MINPIKKLKTIQKAFSEPLPLEEKWYQDRLEECTKCSYNTDNTPVESMSSITRLRLASPIGCPSVRFCTACSCCIDQKCAVKTEVCGMKQVGLKPKWSAIEVFSPLDSALSIINMTPEIGDTKSDSKGFTYNFKPSSEATIKFQFRISRTPTFDFTKTTAPCTCTVSDPKVIDKNTVEFSVKLSTVDFKVGLNERLLIVSYMRNKIETKVPVRFLYIKQ